jgi:hypothetical protein
MQLGDTKSLKKAVMAFAVFGIILLIANFGSYYLGMYGLTTAPFAHHQDGLSWRIYDDARKSVGGAMAAGVSTYLAATKNQNDKSKPAA